MKTNQAPATVGPQVKRELRLEKRKLLLRDLVRDRWMYLMLRQACCILSFLNTCRCTG